MYVYETSLCKTNYIVLYVCVSVLDWYPQNHTDYYLTYS